MKPLNHAMPSASTAADPRFQAQYAGTNTSLEPLIPAEITTALDLGCGHGGMAAWLADRGIAVDGVSWNPEELLEAGRFCRHVMECDLNQGMPNLRENSYDCAICSHVLEHIAYPQQLLKDVYRAVSFDGYLLIAIPNVFFWSDRIKLLMGRWEYQESGTFDYTHVRWYTRQSMIELVTSYGFVLDMFLAEGWIPLPGLRFLVGQRLRAQLNAYACRWMPGLFGRQLIFRFRKR